MTEIDESDDNETNRTEKAYCCSNYPQSEANLIAKFDIVLEAIGVLSFIISIATVASQESPELKTTQFNAKVQNVFNQTGDPSYFFHWPKGAQLLVLSLCLVCCIIGIIFSIILWLGVKRKNHAYLLTWFIFTLICQLSFTILGIVAVVKSSDRVMGSVCTVTFFLYKWYCLWIVKLLMSEIRAVREGYANPLDDGEIDHVNNLIPNSDSFNVDKF